MDSPPDTPLWSILLPTVVNRSAIFARLHAELKRQSEGKSVELVVACDAKEISIGKKRQNLLEAAKGEYVSFIDDDDWIAPDYVDRILAALERRPDCVGFEIECTFNGGEPQRAITSLRYRQWGSNQDGYAFTRSIYHKSCTRRDLAMLAGFPDIRFGEDKVYSDRLQAHLKTEMFVPQVLYHYRYRREPFAQKYGIKNGQVGSIKGINYAHIRRPFQH